MSKYEKEGPEKQNRNVFEQIAQFAAQTEECVLMVKMLKKHFA